MTIKCIHTGDLHLGMEFKNASFDIDYGKKRRIELWQTFDRIVNRAINNKVDFLFIAGDLFEDDYCSLGDIKRIAGKFAEAKNVNIVIATGNHDILTDKSFYRLVKWPENVYIFNNSVEKIEFEKFNTVIWGLSWDKKEEKRNLVDNIKAQEQGKINVLLAHGDTFNKDSQYLPINKDLLINSGFDYVALGHIHKPQFITERIAYCGSPEPLDFGETGLHGIIEGIVSKEKVDMQFVPFSKRMFITKEVQIDSEMTYQDIINKIIQCDDEDSRSNNIYRIILKGIRDRDIALDINELKESIKNNFNYVEIIDKTEPDYDLDKIKKENKDNIIGYFIKEMEQKNLKDPVVKDALYYGLEALLKEKV
ncbi:metallophosphoesterase family protein [Caldisalinibacter kiritimatiensis]|uniref:Exonuclease SbcD n=1 Tax=Caldisalinibacter kiritimatiensis TaxID=1304284 RepID=R1AW62_9FIRM|nr:DNA repair exonuclease [Caldisalinibacter kiritimatiensis]EOD00872.1 Exonuclease SbcD [Caldisalinibacter kiritimatiensis]